MARFPRWIWIVGALTACAFSPPETEGIPLSDSRTDFALEGRFSFRHEDSNYYGRLSWRRAGAMNSILLSSSFGQGMAEMTTDEHGARLVLGDGKAHEADKAEALTFRLLGYPLSIERLAEWIQGRNSGGDADVDAFGRLRRLRHEGWIVDYDYDSDDARAAPARIVAVRADESVELRLRIDERQVSTRGERLP
jgi:outer membrane lipoprotein LolB